MHAFSHVTGGGLAANLARVLPAGLTATVDRSTWTPPPVFGLVGALGGVPRADLERTLNLGVGMVAVVGAEAPTPRSPGWPRSGMPAWVLGTVAGDEDGPPVVSQDVVRGAKGVHGGTVRTVGEHPD